MPSGIKIFSGIILIFSILMIAIGIYALVAANNYIAVDGVVSSSDCNVVPFRGASGVVFFRYDCALDVGYTIDTKAYTSKVKTSSTNHFINGQAIKLDVNKNDLNTAEVHIDNRATMGGSVLGCGLLLFFCSVSGFAV